MDEEKSSRRRPWSLGRLFLPRKLHERLQFERYYIHSFLRRRIFPHFADGIKVLDAGSGRIEEQYLRAEILATGAQLDTLDMCEGEGVDYVGDAAKMDFADGAYDIVLCTQVLEHVPDPWQVCAELHRVLKPGGQIAVTAPQSEFLHNLPYHYFHFTNIGLRMILEEAGFEVREVEPQGGHFVFLAVNLHYTCTVLKEAAKTPLSKAILLPVELVCRIVFGLFFKLLSVWLDRVIPFEGNTKGWCFYCVKPREEAKGDPA